MSTGTARAFEPTATTRSVPRYKLAVPLDLTVLRSGVPDRFAGRTIELGDGGLGVCTPSQLIVGESVRVEFLVPHLDMPVRATAVVRYQRGGCFGLQFLRLPSEQQSIIQYWTRREGELVLESRKGVREAPAAREATGSFPLATYVEVEESGRKARERRAAGLIAVLLLIVGGLVWWRWQQGWNEIEAQVPNADAVVTTPQVTLPADVMERRILHKFLPEYPQSARGAGLQGTVVLDAIVGAQGTVLEVKALSGPEALSKAAMEAVRWWRYQPYVVNGQAVAVETTVQLDFRLAN